MVETLTWAVETPRSQEKYAWRSFGCAKLPDACGQANGCSMASAGGVTRQLGTLSGQSQ